MRPRVVVALVLAGLIAAAAALSAAHAPAGPAKRKPPKPIVVMLILDEFPIDSILQPDGSIDAARFPNFAALAATSTWFPNATSVYDSTFKAVPSILDARLPKKGTAPDLRDHRRNVYTLFDELGYGVVDTEPATALCPPRICRGARTRRPGVLARLNRGGRPARLRRWINSIRPRRKPALYLQHALLPHEPWLYLPSGHQSRPSGNDPIEGINKPAGFHDPDLTQSNHQRYLLQTGFVDHELGVLLGRLRKTGLLDRALLVVTADHGYSFELGTSDRRKVSATNIEQIAPVPLFIKGRGQRRARVVDTQVRTVDILPTIASQLGTRLGWRHDGQSAFGKAAHSRQTVEMVTRDFSRTIRVGSAQMQQRRRAVRERRASTFGSGFDSQVLFGSPWASLFRSGPHPELIGRRPAARRLDAAGGSRLANANLLRNVNPAAKLLPTRFTGRLTGGARATKRDLAAAVNGRIAAVGRSFYLRGDQREWFSLMVPEESLTKGRNRVRLYEVDEGGELLALPGPGAG